VTYSVVLLYYFVLNSGLCVENSPTPHQQLLHYINIILQCVCLAGFSYWKKALLKNLHCSLLTNRKAQRNGNLTYYKLIIYAFEIRRGLIGQPTLLFSKG